MATSNEDRATKLADIEADLKSLERREWQRWASVIAVSLLLTIGVLSLSLPAFTRGFAEQLDLNVRAMGLLGIVLIFDCFALYQQFIMSRQRRDLTQKVGMVAALEVLRPHQQTPRTQHRERKYVRFYFDSRIRITRMVDGRAVDLFGRTCDISEGGLGIVIPESIEPGTEVHFQLSFAPGSKLAMEAIVRQTRGFHHCLEFLEKSPDDARIIRKACIGASPISEWAPEGVRTETQPL